jgi:signal recognition particle subunit SRP19
MNMVDVNSIQYEELILKTKDWKVLYPLYFDKSVSRADGRKVASNIAVDTPDVDDLVKMLTFLKIPMVVEMNKRHPSDHFCVGRIRYNLKNEDGTWANEEV